jgi:hypothetical protein
MPNDEARVTSLQAELGRLLSYVSRVALAIRLYSAYNPSKKYTLGQEICDIDLMWLSDSLHNFNMLGDAIIMGQRESIDDSCDFLISAYKGYLQIDHPNTLNNPRRASAPAFARNEQYFLLNDGISILEAIKKKCGLTDA